VVDWSLSERIAAMVAADPGVDPARPSLDEVARDSERLVSGYTGLAAPAPLPRPELVGRTAWARANLRSMAPLLEPVVERAGEGLGPLAAPLRAGAGVVVAAEVGAVLGLLSRRVLGQYELVLLDPHSPPRLLFVAPNLDEAVRSMAVDADEFVRWVAMHEVTHALQFAAAPWLRDHLAGMLRELLESLEVRLDAARALRLPRPGDLRALLDALADGDLTSLVATPAQRETLDRMQATMAVVEGYAEHAMDVVGERVLPSLPKLRAAMERRRASASAPARLLQRLLGLELKLRQYRLGKAFCDEVAARGGIGALNRVWQSPGMMPTLDELADPTRWEARTRVPSVTSSGA
jgi:coenzyme F420 biosynthesis associated uncharacterized protein